MPVASAAHITAEDHNQWLDVCRALAIVGVLLGHARLFVRDLLPELEFLRAASFVGVELFFALSGFLIGGILLDHMERGDRHWLRNFYFRRWWRTLPNYYLFLLINGLLLYTALRPGTAPEPWQYAVLAQSLLWPHPSFFAEAWSLAIEELFYLLFPPFVICSAALFRVSQARATAWVAVWVILTMPLLRWMCIDPLVSWDEGPRKVALLRLDAIMVGVLAAWLCRFKVRYLHAASVWAALAVMVAALAVWTRLSAEQLDASLGARTVFFSAVSLGCAAFVLVGRGWRISAVWFDRPVRMLARTSYAAYLTNIPAMFLVLKCAEGLPQTLVHPMLLALAYLSLSMLTAWGVQRWFESVFLRWRDLHVPRMR